VPTIALKRYSLRGKNAVRYGTFKCAFGVSEDSGAVLVRGI
jgi:hypothetical protein